jgi:lipopolysaccharide export LptBFGC system permease protein LptF
MKIWQKHILGKLIKTFFFFLFCLLAIYVVVDLSAHGVRFLSKSSFADITLFYLQSFASLLDLFLTLTFLLATMRVLIDLTSHREIVALQMAGISKKGLLAPFFYFAGCLSLVCYLNTQWFAPDAQELANRFKTAHKSKKNKTEQIRVFTVSLEDESELIYRSFDKGKKELFDVFWVRAPNDIWHMKSFKIDALEGQYVNHLIRNEKKQLEKAESFPNRVFSELPWDDEVVLHRFVPYESRSISTLFLQALSFPSESRIIFSHLYYKLLVPLMPFLVLFAVGPMTMRYSRSRPIFLITAYSIFCFIALKVTLDGMLILGENQVIPSYVAIWGPILLSLSFTLPSFARMR